MRPEFCPDCESQVELVGFSEVWKCLECGWFGVLPPKRIVIEMVDGEWRDEDAQKIVDFLGLPDSAESLDRIGMGLLDYLASFGPQETP